MGDYKYTRVKRNSISKLSFSLPKYDIAISRLYNEVSDALHMQDEVLRCFPPMSVMHSGTTRFLTQPNILEAPYRQHRNTTSTEIKTVTQTNAVKFKEFLSALILPLLDQLKEHTGEVINQTCDITGNNVSAKDRNLWNAYIEALEKMEMHFNDDGNPVFLIHPPEFYEKLSKIKPTNQQLQTIEKIFSDKRKEHYAKKPTRRLS
jgi:hypothetical protein